MRAQDVQDLVGPAALDSEQEDRPAAHAAPRRRLATAAGSGSMPRGARAAPDPRPEQGLDEHPLLRRAVALPRRRVGGAENSMRLIAEGLAARGHRVAFASLRPDPLPFPRRFAVNGVERAALPEPAPVARSPARRQARPRVAPPGAARLGPGGERVLGPEGPKADVLYVFYEMEFLAEALRAREAARPGMAIVMRMAGLGWADALRPRRRRSGREHPPLQRGRRDQLPLAELARARRGEGGRARPPARAARELRRRHRRRRRPGAARLGAVRAPGPGSTSSSRPASPRRRSARTC